MRIRKVGQNSKISDVEQVTKDLLVDNEFERATLVGGSYFCEGGETADTIGPSAISWD